MNNTDNNQNHARKQGFSLIELLVVIAIISILIAVGYPSYRDTMIKSKRSDAHLALLSAVQAMERCKSTQFRFTNCTLPAQLTTSPEGYYALALNPAPTANAFTIVATAQDQQTADSECTTLAINSLGIRSSTPGAANTDANNCWN